MRSPVFIFIVLIAIISSCRNDFETVKSNGNLTFSKDTVFLDTVFTNIGSATYNLKVYNNSKDAISIPSIHLENGASSFYRLNVDGLPGKSFDDVRILGKDSIYIFVETTIDFSQVQNPLYTDKIIFQHSASTQDVDLVTLVQDAHFLYPNKDSEGLVEQIVIGRNDEGEEITVNGFYLDENTTFTNEKPYVIYGYCAVQENLELNIEEGAALHFHENSGIIVEKGASIQIDGSLENPVTLEGDRLEFDFENIPGQWGTLWLRAGSKNNSINHAIIKNASAGIIVDSLGSASTPTLNISNTQIYNSATYGLLARETHIEGHNLVINNSGQSSLALTIGGTYEFSHSTFTNFWAGGFRSFPSVYINNYFLGEDGVVGRDLKQANFTNCIIDGSNSIELELDNEDSAEFNFKFTNNALRFNDFNNNYAGIPEYDFNNVELYENNLINPVINYLLPFENQLMVNTSSEIVGQAETTNSTKFPFDIIGTSRSLPATIGAYEPIEF